MLLMTFSPQIPPIRKNQCDSQLSGKSVHEENHEWWVEAVIQALFGAVDNSPPIKTN